MAEENDARSKGVASKFNDQKGYGFITLDEGGEDLFVHQTVIKSDGYQTLREGQIVEITIILEGVKTKAIDVTIVDGGWGDFSSRRGSRYRKHAGWAQTNTFVSKYGKYAGWGQTLLFIAELPSQKALLPSSFWGAEERSPAINFVEVLGVVRGSEKPSIFVPTNDPSK